MSEEGQSRMCLEHLEAPSCKTMVVMSRGEGRIIAGADEAAIDWGGEDVEEEKAEPKQPLPEGAPTFDQTSSQTSPQTRVKKKEAKNVEDVKCHDLKEIFEAELDEDRRACAICLDETKTRVGCFLPCGHCASCMECGITCKVCPFCHVKVENFLHISKVSVQVKLFFS